MGETISEKILARASGREKVKPGEIVKAQVDLAMMPDLTSILAVKAMKGMGREKVWDTGKVVIIIDHIAPASSINAATLHRNIRKFVKEQSLRFFYDVESGVCHQVLSDKGHVKPGMLVVGADSHTCTHGAFGAFATGIGSTDMGAVLATGKIWLKVPETIKVKIEGELSEMVAPKDVILRVIGEIGAEGATYRAVEFTGSTISDMSIPGRMTVCNMAIEMGGKTGLVEPDEKTLEFLKGKTKGIFDPIKSDPDSKYERSLNLDVSDLEPQIACPHKVDNVKPLSRIAGLKIDQVFIGSCTNGRFDDLQIAAELLKGKRIHPGTRLLVVPASREVYIESLEAGLIDVFLKAGAVFSNPSCGACFGGHIGILAPGEIGLTTSNRNFKGRQGSRDAEVYLSSPAVAAASAIAGAISDPRELT